MKWSLLHILSSSLVKRRMCFPSASSSSLSSSFPPVSSLLYASCCFFSSSCVCASLHFPHASAQLGLVIAGSTLELAATLRVAMQLVWILPLQKLQGHVPAWLQVWQL